ncbi:hypothetical protein CL655_04080 [bacterium]|nr:hypothetical protein [bacterium]|tara:strand:- start:5558 stop:5758 length:201 start_codon:yes stop_codon:yes gene_type:complete
MLKTLIILAAAIVFAYYATVVFESSFGESWEGNQKPEPVACTADAMQCPDGSYVGRSGPNCEFVCP